MSKVCPGLAGRRTKIDDDSDSMQKLEELLNGDTRVQRESTDSTAAPVEVVHVLSEESHGQDAPSGSQPKREEVVTRSSSQVSTESVVLLDQGDVSMKADSIGSATQSTSPTPPMQPIFRRVVPGSREARSPLGARTMTMAAATRGVATPGRRGPVLAQSASALRSQAMPGARASQPAVQPGFRQGQLGGSLQMSSAYDRSRVYATR